MIGFCGALDFEGKAVKFSVLKRMCGLHGTGCAYIKDEFGILCDCGADFDGSMLQPLTLSYNNRLYTAAIVCSDVLCDGSNAAQSLLEGYFEEGEDFIGRLDFPYALALYDARCGELTLAKGEKGDKALFYTKRDGTLYFASSLRPLIRLYGGCVRVDREALTAHILGGYNCFPEGLFCDIMAIKPSHALLCSAFGQNYVSNTSLSCERENDSFAVQIPSLKELGDVRCALGEALFAFDYPQFDCYMPYIFPLLKSAADAKKKTLYLPDATCELSFEYSTERAERLGAMRSIEIHTTSEGVKPISKKALHSMEKQLDGILSEYTKGCVKQELTELPSQIAEEKSTPLRIRKKGMLCQTYMWLEAFNIVLV